jgi:Flp pilus assembly pilin Flp
MRGQGLAEYALILALIAVIAIASLVLLGNQIAGFLDEIGSQLNNVPPSTAP